MESRVLQHLGEEAAASYLRRSGMRVLARNWRIKAGEIDIVAMDGRRLVFVEVKAREHDRFADPALAVGWDKQRRLRRLAEAYIAITSPDFEDCRFDVVSVIAAATGPKLRHIPAAF